MSQKFLTTPSNLLNTPYGFYFRMQVPKRYRDYFKRREFKKSLQTSDLKEAQKRALLLATQVEDCIMRLDVLRGYRMARLPFINFSEIKVATVDVNLQGFQIQGIETDPLNADSEVKTYRAMLAAAREEHIKLLQEAAALGLTPSTALSTQPNLAQLPAQLPATPATLLNKKLLFAELIEKFVQEKIDRGSWKKDSKNGRKQQLIRCFEHFGDCDVSTITRDAALEFMNILSKLPPNMKKKKQFAKLSISAAAAKNKGPTLSPKSVNMALNDISSFYIWCVRCDYAAKNPFEGLSVKELSQAITQRLPWPIDELQQLFADDLFHRQSCKPSEYFLPLLGLYTGARLNELCQLLTTDLHEIADIWVIHINNDEVDKSIKTADSRRYVPLHPELIRLNFVEYVKRLKPGQVFPNLDYADGLHSGKYSKRFGTVRRRAKIEESDYHSFRHSVTAELEKLNIREHLVSALLGHKHKQITFGRYGAPKHVRRLYRIISRLTFPIDVPPWGIKKKFGTAKCRNRQKASTTIEPFEVSRVTVAESGNLSIATPVEASNAPQVANGWIRRPKASQSESTAPRES